MIWETLILVYALGAVLMGAAVGLMRDDEVTAPIGALVMVALIPGLNLVIGASGIAEYVRRRQAPTPPAQEASE